MRTEMRNAECRMRNKNPKTEKEWQAAVNAAHGALALDSARMYGLVTGGPKVDQKRCIEILEKGKKLGIMPEDDSIDRFIKDLQQAQGRG